jgi:hypothetical protein
LNSPRCFKKDAKIHSIGKLRQQNTAMQPCITTAVAYFKGNQV